MNRCVVWPAIEDMPTIDPPPPRIIAAAACLMHKNVPTRFRSTVARHPSTSDATIGPPCNDPPAQANRTSSRPVGSQADATARSTSASSVTSQTTNRTLAPGAAAFSISAVASARRASVRPAIVTCAPSAANRFAHPSPIPLPPPVTSAAIPSMPDTAARLRVDDRDRLLRADPSRLVALLTQIVGRLLLQHVQEVVFADLEDLRRGGHTQRIALAFVEVDDDAEAHCVPPVDTNGRHRSAPLRRASVRRFHGSGPLGAPARELAEPPVPCRADVVHPDRGVGKRPGRQTEHDAATVSLSTHQTRFLEQCEMLDD